jgi:hypothetical protein
MMFKHSDWRFAALQSLGLAAAMFGTLATLSVCAVVAGFRRNGSVIRSRVTGCLDQREVAGHYTSW